MSNEINPAPSHWVELAIFTSADNGQNSGYQIIARSPGIDRDSANTISRWSSTQAPHSSCRQCCFSGYPLADGRLVINRTIDGGPEYSCRGGVRWVSVSLVFSSEHAASFENHPIQMLRTAIAAGVLRMPFPMPTGVIEPVLFPGESWFTNPFSEDRPSGLEFVEDRFKAIHEHLQQGTAAWTGSTSPVADAEAFFDGCAPDQRAQIAWTIGLTPSRSRPFEIYFLGALDAAANRQFASQRIKLFSATAMDHQRVTSRT